MRVTFDIDANGIVNVTAKDKATGKVQNITIQSSRLSDEEIEKMRRDAEANEDEDKKKKELIEARNEGDSAAYNAEKALKDLGSEATPDEKSAVEGKIKTLRDLLTSEDTKAIKSAIEDLMTAMHPIFAESLCEGSFCPAGREPDSRRTGCR